MLPKTIDDYGGPFVDEGIIYDPTSQQGASHGNRSLEDQAQCTRTIGLAWVMFETTTDAAPITMDPSTITHFTVWGSSSPTKPIVQKLDVGEYRITFATSFDDALVGVPGMETVAETQQVVFTMGTKPNVYGNTVGDGRINSINANVIDIDVRDAAGAKSDLVTGTQISFTLR